MRLLGLVFLLSPCVLAQSGAPDAACGSPVAAFKVSHDKTQHPTPSPQDGDAMLYVLGSVYFAGPETVALGIDGTWVGAVNDNAYFSVPITPGQHHLCARFSGKTGGPLLLPLFKVRDVRFIHWMSVREVPTTCGFSWDYTRGLCWICSTRMRESSYFRIRSSVLRTSSKADG